MRGGTVDVVIVDYQMPDMTGTDAAALIRRLNPNVTIVLFSGYPPALPTHWRSMVDFWVEKPNLQALLQFLENRQNFQNTRLLN